MVNQVEPAGGFLPSTVCVGDLAKPELLATLRAHEILLNQAAEELFADHRFEPSRQAKVIGIEALTVSDLGFREGGTYGQLAARALEFGLVECPLELGPYLRLQFLNQPEAPVGHSLTKRGAPSGAITIASMPLDKTDKAPKGFYLRHVDGSRWLRGYWAELDHVWSQEAVWVFSREGGAA